MSDLSAQLAEFRGAHPVISFQHEGLTWRYRVAGHGKQGLCMFPGAVGDADAYFFVVPRLMRTHRILLMSYPDAERVDQFVDGVRAILDREALSSIDLLGGSYGGVVVQAVVQRLPHAVRRVVLSATGPAKRQRSTANARASRVISALPLWFTRALLRLIVRLTTKNVQEGRVFWRAFYNDAIAALPKSSLRVRYALASDLDRCGPVSEADVREWRGEALILGGDKDAIARPEVGRALAAMFPRAKYHMFPGAGHGIALERPAAWADAVVGFLT